MINEIRNTTVYNKELIVRYNKYYSKSFLIKNVLIMGIITVGFSIYMLAKKEYLYALLLYAILIFYYILTVLLQKLTVKRMLKRSPLVENPVTQTYVFNKDKLTIDNTKQTYIVSLDSILSVKEADSFYMIKTNDRKMLIVDKEGFHSQKDKQDIRSFFVVRFNMKD